LFNYYFILFLSVLMLIGSILSIRYYIKKVKKSSSSYKVPIKDMIVVIAFTLLSLFVFLNAIRFLPTVILDKTEIYEGECEIFIFDSSRGGSLEIYFEEKVFSFSSQGHSVEQEGKYYCEVEYYRYSNIGKSITIYQSKEGKKVEPKKQF